MTQPASIRETCRPRPDVLAGGLVDKHFAAQLDQVVRDAEGYETYADADSFFALTFPTQGLKELLRGTFARLSGQAAQTPSAEHAVYRYETSFGGGKTHGLIALWHIASGARPSNLEEFVDPGLLPAQCRIAAVVGDSLDPLNGLTVEEETTFTLWGEIGRQLGGQAAEAMARSDAARTGCGKQVWMDMLSEAPTVIVIDELAQYLHRLAASGDAEVQKLADATVDNLKILFEAATAAPAVRIIVTLATGTAAFGKKTDEVTEMLSSVASERLLREAAEVMERPKGAIGKPAEDEEIGFILRRRLFEHVDEAAAATTAEAYRGFYADLERKNVQAKGATSDPSGYCERLRLSYPFHPALIDCLDKRIGPLPGFQRARGALKMLAEGVRRIWADAADMPIINLGDLPLEDGQVRASLTTSIGKEELNAPATADFAGADTHAARIDERRRWPQRITTRACRAVFTHSVAGEPSPGASIYDVYLGTLRPGEDPSLAVEALGAALAEAWHLITDEGRWRFTTEPNANRIIASEMENVSKSEVTEELNRRIVRLFPSEGEVKAVHWPSAPAHVPDEPRLHLAVFSYADVQVSASKGSNANAPPPAFQPSSIILDILHFSGAAESNRTYRNGVVALVSDEAELETIRQRIQFELAARRLADDPQRTSDFTSGVRKLLKKLADGANLKTSIAVCRAYRHLYWPERAPGNDDLRHFELPPVDQGQAKKSQTKTILSTLREYGKIADKAPPTDRLVRATGFRRSEELTTSELGEVPWRDHGQQMLLDATLVRTAIESGVKNGIWVYYDAGSERAWGAGGRPITVRIASDAWLYSPGRARELGLLRKPVTSASIVSALASHGSDGEIGGAALRARLEELLGGEPTKKEVLRALATQALMADAPIVVLSPAKAGATPLTVAGIERARLDDLTVLTAVRAAELDIKAEGKKDRKVKGTGSVGVSFQHVEDRIADLESPAVTAVGVTASVDPGEGASDLRRLGYAISQLPRWGCRVDVKVTVEFEGMSGGLQAELAGDSDSYQRLEDLLLKLADVGKDVSGRMRLLLTPARPVTISSAEWRQMRDVLAANDPGRLSVEADLAESG